jgi:hypothetical protein
MPESIVLRRNALTWIRIASPGVRGIPVFMSAPQAVPSNLAVAHVRSPHGKRDHAIHRLISVNAARARSPMANGNYATELLNSLDAAHARSPMANGDYATELLNSLDAAHARSPMANGDYATHRLIPIRTA